MDIIHTVLCMSNTNDPSGLSILLPNYYNTGRNAIDNVERIGAERIPRRIERNNARLDGREIPSSATGDSSLRSSLPARQPSAGNITQNPENVNQNIINALTDNNKTRKLINAVQSGEDDIAQTASNIVEDFARKQASCERANPAFNDSIN